MALLGRKSGEYRVLCHKPEQLDLFPDGPGTETCCIGSNLLPSWQPSLPASEQPSLPATIPTPCSPSELTCLSTACAEDATYVGLVYSLDTPLLCGVSLLPFFIASVQLVPSFLQLCRRKVSPSFALRLKTIDHDSRFANACPGVHQESVHNNRVITQEDSTSAQRLVVVVVVAVLPLVPGLVALLARIRGLQGAIGRPATLQGRRPSFLDSKAPLLVEPVPLGRFLGKVRFSRVGQQGRSAG